MSHMLEKQCEICKSQTGLREVVIIHHNFTLCYQCEQHIIERTVEGELKL